MEFLPLSIALSVWVNSITLPVITLLSSAYTKSIKPMIYYISSIAMFKISLNTLWSNENHNNYFYNQCCKFYYTPTTNQEVIPQTKIIITTFPHGMFCIGYNASGGFKAGCNYYKAVSNILMRLPILNVWLQKLNYTSIDKNNIIKIMEKGDNISILPGGFNELIILRKYQYNIYIPTGFIALACKYGYTIKPCLSLGENETFSALSPPKFMWKYLFRLMKVVTLPLSIPYWLHRVPIVTLYGEPIECKPGDNVLEIREKLVNILTKLFDDNIVDYCNYRNSLKIQPIVNVNNYSINFYGQTK